MRRDSHKIDRSFRTVIEQLERRMLLSVWDGTWHVQGTVLNAENGTAFTQKSMAPTARITSSAIPGQYTLTVSGPGMKTETMVLIGDDTEIQSSNPQDTSDSYLKLFMVDPGVIAVVNASVDYTDASKTAVSQMSMFGGIATLKAAPMVDFAWDGQYHVHDVGITFGQDDQNPGLQWKTESQDIIATPTPVGSGNYAFAPVGGSDGADQPLFSPSGKALVATYSGPTAWDPSTSERKYERIWRGPYGRLYHVGGDAEFDANTGQLRSAWFAASYTDPHVNIAPTLNPAGSPFMSDIDEDDTDSSGTLVGDLLDRGGSTYIYDPNTGDGRGIAVVKLDTKHGTWQYSTDGTTWNDTNKVNASSALLLASDAALRFVPKANYFGELPKAVTFRAWDQTTGTNGGRASVNASAGTSAFSKALDTASLTVKAVNDAPTISGNSTALTYTAGAKPISIFSGMKLTDVDSKMITSATVTFAGGYDPATDVITYRGPKTIQASIDAATGTIQLTSTTPQKLSTYQTALKGIFFNTNSRHTPITLTFDVVDEDAAKILNETVSVDRVLQIV